MATFHVQTPDGSTYEIEAPDNASDDQIKSFAQQRIHSEQPDAHYAAPVIDRSGTGADALNKYDPVKPDLAAAVMQGGTFGLSDEIAGGFGALTDAVLSPFRSDIDFNPVASYQAYRDRERATLAATHKAYPWLSSGMEIAGGLLPSLGIGTATGFLQGAGTQTLGAAAKRGAALGAAGGAVSGFGYGEGASNSIAGAGLGAALGAGIGGGAPIAASLVARPIQTAVNYMRPQNGLGRDLVAKALRDDAITPTAAATALSGASQRGVPLGLMDLGENLRGLTGAVSRAPGVSRRLVREAVGNRQAGQGERITSALERDLGPIDNVPERSDAIIADANRRAGPLYDQAYATPGRTSEELQSLLATPAGRQALARARTIAANERRDPTALGFDLNDQGETILTHVPSVQTLDYVKRGLDDIVEANRDPVTRRLHLDEAGRAINQARGQFVSEVDRLNPGPYREARGIYQGAAQERDALQMGTKFPGMSAEQIERATNGMTDPQRAQAALGYRSKLAEDLERRVAGGDKVNALIGTPRKQGALASVFGGDGNFPRFADTLGDESMAAETYRQIMTNSTTADKQAFDKTVSDPSLLEDVAGSAIKGAANGGLAGVGAELLSRIRDTSRFGAGATGQRTREEAAALLSETDPLALSQAMREALRQSALRRVGTRAGRRRAVAAGMFGSRLAGGIAGYALRPIDD